MRQWESGSRRTGERALTQRLVLAVVLVALVFVFIVENPRETKIRFIVPRVTAPLWIALFVAAILGALAGAPSLATSPLPSLDGSAAGSATRRPRLTETGDCQHGS